MLNRKVTAASLQVAIERWIDETCESDHWIESYFPPEGVSLMTDAAMAVLDSVEASGLFTENEMGTK